MSPAIIINIVVNDSNQVKWPVLRKLVNTNNQKGLSQNRTNWTTITNLTLLSPRQNKPKHEFCFFTTTFCDSYI